MLSTCVVTSLALLCIFCSLSGNKPTQERPQPGEQRPGNLRPHQDSQGTKETPAKHQQDGDRRDQQERGEYNPASLPCLLIIQEEEENESAQHTRHKE